MVYELREYTAVPGRLPALIRRFNDHTIGLFAKHDMELVFISKTALGDDSANELVYLMRFDDSADMDRKWAAFFKDPEWKEAKKASEADGPLVVSVRRRLLDPSAFGSR
jgi:hypothetical protein